MLNSRPFLANLAKTLLDQHQNDLGGISIVFPNRRAGVFFEKYLSEQINTPIWSPQILSMEEFVKAKSSMKEGDQIELIFHLFDVFKTLNPSSESFEQFFFWGEVILKDFSEIDHYMVNPDHIFSVVKSQKELDELFIDMDEDHKALLSTFWQNFLPEANGTKTAFLKIWNILAPLYQSYKEKISEHGISYKGAIYRMVAESIDTQEATPNLVFAGYNALTKAEEKIIKFYLTKAKAQIYWDIDAYYVKNQDQEAGNFIREHLKDAILSSTIPDPAPALLNDPEKSITTVGCSLEVSQTKALSKALSALALQPDFVSDRVAIVLPHEHLLFPVLNAIPERIASINITMGYPLKDTPVFKLMFSLVKLWRNSRKTDKGFLLFHKNVFDLLLHPYIHPTNQELINELTYGFRKFNSVYIHSEELSSLNAFFKLLFTPPDNEALLSYVQQILIKIFDSPISNLEKEFLKQAILSIQELSDVLVRTDAQIDIDALDAMLQKIISSIKIPFTGEPLKGLQIMGVLETRNLDFEHVFILSSNEDSLPASSKTASFIPYNIRKAFGVPTFEQNDAIYAYLFYRLIQRADHVTMYYNTVADFGISGEKSRFIMQLMHESDIKVIDKTLETEIGIATRPEITIPKSEAAMNKLYRFLNKANQQFEDRLAPTALTTYLDCRLRFYFKYIARIKEPEELKEELDAASFGTILHDALEILYKHHKERYKRSTVDKSDFDYLKACVSGAIEEAFQKHYNVSKKEIRLEGRNVIAYDILTLFINKVLAFDADYAPFEIRGLESGSRDGYKIDHPLVVDGQQRYVGIKGIIDRIDKKDNLVRILDYKTGKDDKSIPDIASLFDRDYDKRNKAGFQTFLYGWLYMNKYKNETDQVLAGLFNIRELFTDNFKPALSIKEGKSKIEILDIKPYLDDFIMGVTDMLEELFDRNVPFDQTEDITKCKWCAYNNICQRP